MTPNVGSIDRVLRVVVGVVLIGLTLMGTIGAWGLDRPRADRHCRAGLVPAVLGAGFQHLPDEEVLSTRHRRPAYARQHGPGQAPDPAAGAASKRSSSPLACKRRRSS